MKHKKEKISAGTPFSIHKPASLMIAAFQREVVGRLGHLSQLDCFTMKSFLRQQTQRWLKSTDALTIGWLKSLCPPELGWCSCSLVSGLGCLLQPKDQLKQLTAHTDQSSSSSPFRTHRPAAPHHPHPAHPFMGTGAAVAESIPSTMGETKFKVLHSVEKL